MVYWILSLPDDERSVRRGVLAATLVHLFLTFSFVGFAADSFANITGRVEHPDVNSYHSEARRVEDVGEWMATFPERVPGFLLHAKTHPPGPILYYVFWNGLFGTHVGALAGGVALGVLGALAIPLLYLVVFDFSRSRRAGLCAATLGAILPGPIIMLTSFDAVYPAATLAMIWLWRRALSADLPAKAARSGALCGFVMLSTLMFAHNILVLGAWFVLATMISLFLDRERLQQSVIAAVVAVAAASVVVVGGFFALFALTGYNHIHALQAAIEMQAALATQLHRPYSFTVFWDPYDYFLAAGWVTIGLIVAFLNGWSGYSKEIRGFAAASLGTLVVVDLSGLLAAEAARVWLFLQPLAVTVASVELARRAVSVRAATCGVVLFALAAIRASMNFI